jgi:preprotein translocase subunit SecF
MLAILFGIVVGTYSSVFIAAPLLILFNLRSARQMAAEADEEERAGKQGAAAG